MPGGHQQGQQAIREHDHNVYAAIHHDSMHFTTQQTHWHDGVIVKRYNQIGFIDIAGCYLHNPTSVIPHAKHMCKPRMYDTAHEKHRLPTRPAKAATSQTNNGNDMSNLWHIRSQPQPNRHFAWECPTIQHRHATSIRFHHQHASVR
jgi:hypothetical protein